MRRERRRAQPRIGTSISRTTARMPTTRRITPRGLIPRTMIAPRRPMSAGVFAPRRPGTPRNMVGSLLRAADGALAWGRMAADDVVHLRRTLDGNDLDAWDPEYIRRVLPLWGTVLHTYFRSEVRGLEHIPEDGPCLLVGNHSGGILIVDTFAFAVGFYERFGPHRRFHQLAHDVAARWPGTGISRWGTVAASHE